MPGVTQVTDGPEAHFFGYYEKSPWDGAERRLLCHEVPFDDRQPRPDDAAGIVVVDEASGEARRVGETNAWNFQQGAMLQWLGPDYEGRILYNDREGDSFVTRIRDLNAGETRTVDSPTYAVAPDGRTAFTLSFARLTALRPGYDYKLPGEQPDPRPAPDDTGVSRLDLETGERELLVSLADLAAFEADETMADATHWVNHVQVSPSGDRIAFLHRWTVAEADHGRGDRLVVVESDGSDPRVVASAPVEGGVSHYDWADDRTVVGWTLEDGMAFHAYDVEAGTVEPYGPDVLVQNGHNSFGPTGRWMLTDTYPDENDEQPLQLYDRETGELVEVGRFHAPPVDDSAVRCDLHPRWDRTGRRVCLDSRHSGTRQLYVVDVTDVTGVAAGD